MAQFSTSGSQTIKGGPFSTTNYSVSNLTVTMSSRVFEMLDNSTGNVLRVSKNYSKRYRVVGVPFKSVVYVHLTDTVKNSTVSMPLEMFENMTCESQDFISRCRVLADESSRKRSGGGDIYKENAPPQKKSKMEDIRVKLVRVGETWQKVPMSLPSSSLPPSSLPQKPPTFLAASAEPLGVGDAWQNVPPLLPPSSLPQKPPTFLAASTESKLMLPAETCQPTKSMLKTLLSKTPPIPQSQSYDMVASPLQQHPCRVDSRVEEPMLSVPLLSSTRIKTPPTMQTRNVFDLFESITPPPTSQNWFDHEFE